MKNYQRKITIIPGINLWEQNTKPLKRSQRPG